MRLFLTCFIQLFVTIDPIGMLPVFMALTDGMTPQRRRSITFEAVAFAMALSVGFMFLGKATFAFLSITEADFRIAGGAILLVLSMIDLLIPGKPAVTEQAASGLFPLALPLIAGPATLTTTLVLAEKSTAMTALGLSLNFGILLVVLLACGTVVRLAGRNALRAFSKLVMVLLAAIAVNMIRTGVAQVIAETRGH
jgi:multiple antibiotic resistance protein